MTSTVDSDIIVNDAKDYGFDKIKYIDIPDYGLDKNAIKQSKIYSMIISIVKQNGNIDDFIAAKDAHYIKLKQEEIENNSSVKYYKSELYRANQACVAATNELNEIKSHSQNLEQLLSEIKELKESYPPEKQADLKAFLSKSINGNQPIYLKNLTKSPSGLFNKLKNYSKMKKANKKLAEFIKSNNIKELSQSLSGNQFAYNDLKAILQLKVPTYCNEQINKLEEKITLSHAEISKNEQLINNKINNEMQNFRSQLNAENNAIRGFVSEKKEVFAKAANLSKEDIKTQGLSNEYIESRILSSSCPNQVSASIHNFYEKLNQPAAPMVGYNLANRQRDLVASLKECGLDAVTDDDPRAANPNVFVVTKDGVHSPFLAPDEALNANIKIIEAVNKLGGKSYLSHPLTRKEIAPAANDIGYNLDVNIIARANGCNYKEILENHISLNDYTDEMVKNVMENGVDPIVMNKENIESLQSKGELASVFHGGFSSDPYAVLVKNEAYGHTYGAAFGAKQKNVSILGKNKEIEQGACDYVTSQGSGNNSKYLSCCGGNIVYGFIFEYESKGKEQGFGDINHASVSDEFNIEKVCEKNETAIFSHQNKLKKIWISAYDQKTQQQKVIPLLLNENGEIADKKWRDFANLHKPIDTCLSENMVAHRNNMIKQYDENCANGMYRTVSELSNNENYVPAEKIDLNKIYKDVYGHTEAQSQVQQPQVQQPQVQQPQVQQPIISNEQSMQYDKFVATNAGAKLRAACTDMLNKEPDKYAKIVRDWNVQYNADPAHPENAVNTVLATYKQDLMPYVESVMKFEQYDKFMENDSYKKLYSACMDMKDKDQATYNKVVRDWNAQYNANPAQHGTIVQNIIAKYKQDLMPYVEPAMNDAQTATLSNSLEGKTYSSMSNNDKKTFVTALRTGDNMISGEGFKEATAHIQPNVAQAMINVQTATLSNSQEEQAYGSMSNNDKKTFVTALRTGDNTISGEGFRKTTAHIQPQQTNTYADKSNLSFAQMQQKSSSGRE